VSGVARGLGISRPAVDDSQRARRLTIYSRKDHLPAHLPRLSVATTNGCLAKDANAFTHRAISLSTISTNPSHFISFPLPMSRPRHLDPLRLHTLTSALRPPSLQYLLPSSLLHLKHSAFTPSVTTSMFHFAQLCSVCCPRLD
jgi:hypothetical protein